ncbi:hypothetical protein C5167_041610 [Papaver somniferum]|uniref:wall-associated receptor kinase 1-like n=1 Tax=Papaver somniferum TaxID=3469 RepID=UPI000E6F9F7F|nr:wall-associated receptor kinase 1-like [Papaver somniferum]RZC85429.1 hypothetical protein C5167_041610 [Papaver somniferum]
MALLPVLLKFQCFVLLLWLELAFAEIPSTASEVIAIPGCRDRCGKVSIPYPFGIGVGCFRSKEFIIECQDNLPRYQGVLNVTSISVLDGQMTFESGIARTCSYEDVSTIIFGLGIFTLSTTKNKLISIGCDTWARINGDPYIGKGCSDCTVKEAATNGSCGIGCCETSISAGVKKYNVTIERQSSKVNPYLSFNPCIYGFIIDKSSFRFSSSYLQDFKNNGSGSVPVVADWTIGVETCDAASRNATSYACGPNTVCKPGNNIAPGYLCDCKPGFAGNPYLNISTGGHCQEISKCNDNSILGCSPPPRSKVGKIIAGTYLSLSLLLVTSFTLGGYLKN